jgi:hypothetical protein
MFSWRSVKNPQLLILKLTELFVLLAWQCSYYVAGYFKAMKATCMKKETEYSSETLYVPTYYTRQRCNLEEHVRIYTTAII